MENCLEIGIKSDKIIVDPGIGFAKTAEHNLEVIKHLRQFTVLKRPLLIGVSRKSFIGKVLEKDVSRRLHGSLAAACAVFSMERILSARMMWGRPKRPR